MIRPLLVAGSLLLLPAVVHAQYHHHGGLGGGVSIGIGGGSYLGGYNYNGFGYPSYAQGYGGLSTNGYAYNYGLGNGNYGLSYGYRGLGYGGIGLGYRGYGYDGLGLGYGYGRPYYGGVYNNYNFMQPYGAYGYGPYSNYGPLTLPATSFGYGPAGSSSLMPAMAPLPDNAGTVVTTIVPRQNNNNNNVNNNAPAAKPAAARPVGDRAGAQQRLTSGDGEFKKQLFQSAYFEYQKARQADPDWAEPYVRRGWALAAMGRYHLAAESFLEGFKRDPQWTQSSFRLDDIYGDNKLAKEAHIDALATLAAAEPTNSDAWMILGLTLYFDGQQERSQPFFSRSAETAPVSDQGLLKSFLAPPPAGDDQEI